MRKGFHLNHRIYLTTFREVKDNFLFFQTYGFRSVIFNGAFMTDKRLQMVFDASKNKKELHPVLVIDREKIYDFDLEFEVMKKVLVLESINFFVSISLSSFNVLRVYYDETVNTKGIFLMPWLGFDSLTVFMKLFFFSCKRIGISKFKGVNFLSLEDYFSKSVFSKKELSIIKKNIDCKNLTAICVSPDFVINSNHVFKIFSNLGVNMKIFKVKPAISYHGIKFDVGEIENLIFG